MSRPQFISLNLTDKAYCVHDLYDKIIDRNFTAKPFFICSDIILETELHKLRNFSMVDSGFEQWSTLILSIILFVYYYN